ncbi:uncharacterized protein N7473_002877 [Penicillium subrubescens]|uniref:Uncharacterized protein n=1 Tax=Penicillium subrubescens TaxID=1316194 RepID=A0A1Q5TDB2_9EURO|nr:uncharacterized protein N7473_002877 [Penicillium subrubescens]KAJ5905961.1 hypothetical protein N7473_002877 [Penicillium subrubescens]OKO98214.1 hypothetical protein PENSUB_9312 [Penicillium subrubescens]
MEISEETVSKIQKFVQNRQAAEKEASQEPFSATALHAYARRLDGTLQQLQEQVRRQADELKKLRESRGSHGLSDNYDDPWMRVSQARRAKKAYDSLVMNEDDLPTTDSVLPSLIATEETSQLINEGKMSILVTADKLSADRERFRIEEANLRDSRAISSGLRDRIQRIRNANTRKQEQTPSQVAREVVREQKKKNKGLDHASDGLKKSLDKFIDESLAPMLAAEDLGGPTVGDALEVSDATLKAGYTAHGKPKKQKEPVEQEDGKQQRIDQFLRPSNDGSNPRNKREAAATEAHELLDALLEAGTSYIDLKRDSAASRFLVRAKVAQFHPRDARRLRLIDFGRSLGD